MAQSMKTLLDNAIAANVRPQNYKNGNEFIVVQKNNRPTNVKLIDKYILTQYGQIYYTDLLHIQPPNIWDHERNVVDGSIRTHDGRFEKNYWK